MKILFAGASGYGNLGDDAYKILYSKYLNGHDLMFDSPFPDMRAVDWSDIVVIGGGGLVYCSPKAPHFDYMEMYMKRALEKGKRLVFSSVGVQYFPQDFKNLTEVLMPWKKYLDAACLITVRNPKCKSILEEVTSNCIHYYPDLCYLIEPCSYHLTLPGAHIFTATMLSTKEGQIQKELQKSVEAGKMIYGIIMTPIDEAPTKHIIKNIPHGGDRYIFRDNLTAPEAARIFADAERVVTARYHGMVFSRAVGTPDIVTVDSRHKSATEIIPDDCSLAKGHICRLREVL